MIRRLENQAERLKISDFGVVRAKVFNDLCLDLREKKSAAFADVNEEKRCNPFLIMPEAKSLIVCLFSYNHPQKGNISKYAMGSDYHSVIKDKLDKFCAPLIREGYRCMAFSDSWDMNERYLAAAAGLGFIGKNHMLISPRFGSFVFIGTVITDCELEEAKPVIKSCADCGACIKNCPGGAISDGGGFEESRCVSYITQKKGVLTKEEEDAVLRSGMLWGCDVCQNVCPHNLHAPFTEIPEFSENLIVNLEVDADMSNREFKRKYYGRAFTWRGISPLVRNQKIFKNR